MFIVLATDGNFYKMNLIQMKFLHSGGKDKFLTYIDWECTVNEHVLSIQNKEDRVKYMLGVCGSNPQSFQPDLSDFKRLNTDKPVKCDIQECYCSTDVGAPKGRTKEDLDRIIAFVREKNDLRIAEKLELYRPSIGEVVAICRTEYVLKDRFHIDWYLSKRCNYDCSYCPATIHDNHSRHYSYDELINIYETTSKAYDLKSKRLITFQISGGEPTANPSYLKLIKYIANDLSPENGFDGELDIRTISNMSRKAKYLYELNQYSSIITGLHMESLTPDRVDSLIEFLKMRDENSKPVAMNALLMPEKKDVFINLYARLQAIKNDVEWTTFQPRPIRDKLNDKHIDYTLAEKRMLSKYYMELGVKGERHKNLEFNYEDD